MQLVRSTRASSITNFVPISRPFSKLTAEGTFLLYLTGGKHNTSARWKARVQNTSNFRVFFCALSTWSVLLVLDSGHCCCCWWWWCNPQRVLTKRSKLDNDEKKWCGPYLHESLRTAGKISAAGQAGIARVQVRIDEALVEAAHREPVEDDLWQGEGGGGKQEM